MSFITRIFGAQGRRGRYRPLYDSIVQHGRDPRWYREGQVPDTVTGRFDMIAALFAIVVLRLEREGSRAASASALLTEIFVADMEGSIRQLGIGDLMVGKHLGRMMSALGGRLAAFRDAEDLSIPVRRNIYHEEPPSEEVVAFTAGQLSDFRDRLASAPLEPILAGELPPL